MNGNAQHDETMDDEPIVAVLQLVTGMSEGKPFWAYMLLPEDRFDAYRAAVEAGETVDLTAYGEALESGWGEVPPEDVHQRMIDEYGFDDYFEQDILEEVKKYTEQTEQG